jgi:hypothetical protein
MFSTKQRAVGGITHLVVNMHLVTRKYGNNVTFEKINQKNISSKVALLSVLGIRHILVWIRMRIRIIGSVPLTNGSGCGFGRPKNIQILRIRIRISNIGYNDLQAALGRGEECKGLPQGQHQVRLSSVPAGLSQKMCYFN